MSAKVITREYIKKFFRLNNSEEDAALLNLIMPRLKLKQYAHNSFICRVGDEANELFFIESGKVVVRGREAQPIVVHITGEVMVPGVLRLDEGARVTDAVSAAGGATAHADLDSLNLARKLEDGEKLIIPQKGAPPGANAPQQEAQPLTNADAPIPEAPPDGGLVNINTASSAQLQSLPGVGAVLAGRIIEYRMGRPFADKSDIMKVSGIGPSTFSNIEALITTGNE